MALISKSCKLISQKNIKVFLRNYDLFLILKPWSSVPWKFEISAVNCSYKNQIFSLKSMFFLLLLLLLLLWKNVLDVINVCLLLPLGTSLITAANFCQNGKLAVVGTYDGRCIFYDTEVWLFFTLPFIGNSCDRILALIFDKVFPRTF